ncbi:MAG: helix-hairpin-helix domain-containing protein [Prevotella sp.]|nr:helix-hairpin-helix domain-containing protein [Prevotella sp.]
MKFTYLIKSDRRAIITLLCIIAAALGGIWLTDGRQESEAVNETKATKKGGSSTPNRPFYQGKPRQAELFLFDPNTADSTALLRLGLQPWQVRNIYKYRAAGGVYRQPRDFARLYGLTLKQYRRLEPYIRIKEENDILADDYFKAHEPAKERDTLRYPVKLQPEERIVLNMADTTALRKVPGIGPHFARKIADYRRRLGGFCSVQQLLEIEDFPTSAVGFFIIPDSTLPKPWLHINRLSLNELKRHPYINFYQARAIVDFRRLHGPLESLRQLSLDRNFPPEAIERLEPYIVY